MMPKIKNIIIFAVIGIALVLIYVFFVQKKGDQASLISSSPVGSASSSTSSPSTSSNKNLEDNKDFLSILLNVKEIKLDDSIFSDVSFSTLRDSSIELLQDGTEGRPNPFAPISVDNTSTSATPTNTSSVTAPAMPKSNSTPVLPAPSKPGSTVSH